MCTSTERKFTRRDAVKLVAAAAAVPAAAQSEGAPQEIVRERFETNARAMKAVKIPTATEPPFHFRP